LTETIKGERDHFWAEINQLQLTLNQNYSEANNYNNHISKLDEKLKDLEQTSHNLR